MKERETPNILFLANRRRIRPFLYYKKQDILLTTKADFPWLQEDKLPLRGASAVALLLQCGNSYRNMVGEALRSQGYDYPPTGFSNAMEKAGILLRNSVLKFITIPVERKPKFPADSMEVDVPYEEDFFEEIIRKLELKEQQKKQKDEHRQ